MKILQLCNKPPYPPLEGGSIAMNNIAQGLIRAGHQVKIIAVNSFKYHISLSQIPQDYQNVTQIELVDVDLRVLPFKAFINLFTNKSYHVERFISDAFDKKIAEVLQKETFDIVQIETIFLAPYISTIQTYSKAKIVIRSHNIEHRIWKRLADNCPFWLKKWYLNHLAKTLKSYELNALNRADGVITISKPDMDYFVQNGCRIPIKVIPFGIPQEQIQTINPTHELKDNTIINIGYIGAMNWFPNIEGVKWFFDKVWDKAFGNQSKIHFHLAGRAIPKEFYDYPFSNVTIHGEVNDAYRFIDQCDIMVTPLFSGSGIRIKIVESMLHGKSVVTTTIGAEGINFSDRHDLVIANTADEFIDAIKMLCENHDLRNIIGVNAHELIHLEHNTALITPRLIDFYKLLIRNE